MRIMTVSLLLIYSRLRESWVRSAASTGIGWYGLLGTRVRSRGRGVSIPSPYSFPGMLQWVLKYNVIYFSLHICLVAFPTVVSSGSWICCLDPCKLPFPWISWSYYVFLKCNGYHATQINLCPLLQGKLFLPVNCKFYQDLTLNTAANIIYADMGKLAMSLKWAYTKPNPELKN